MSAVQGGKKSCQGKKQKPRGFVCLCVRVRAHVRVCERAVVGVACTVERDREEQRECAAFPKTQRHCAGAALVAVSIVWELFLRVQKAALRKVRGVKGGAGQTGESPCSMQSKCNEVAG